MKFNELPKDVQVVAANILAKKLDDEVMWSDKVRTDKAKEIASTVRDAFTELFS